MSLRVEHARRYERRRYGGIVRRINLMATKRALARALGILGRGLILDMPCGTGILHEFLGAAGFEVIGADLSPAMLTVAREKGNGVKHVRADVTRLPFRPGSFEAVLCVRFFMRIPAAERPLVLRGLAALARGPLVVTVCHPYTIKHLTRKVRLMLGWTKKHSPRLTRLELAAEAEAAGLRIERVVPVTPLLSEVWVVVLKNQEIRGPEHGRE
jgi:ubiquinone/menaquinone biosynthesis C-methylase UbiE